MKKVGILVFILMMVAQVGFGMGLQGVYSESKEIADLDLLSEIRNEWFAYWRNEPDEKYKELKAIQETVDGAINIRVRGELGQHVITAEVMPEKNISRMYVLERDGNHQYIYTEGRHIQIAIDSPFETAPDIFSLLENPAKEIYSMDPEELSSFESSTISDIEKIAFGIATKEDIQFLKSKKYNPSQKSRVGEVIRINLLGTRKRDVLIIYEKSDSQDVFFEHYMFTGKYEQVNGEADMFSDSRNWSMEVIDHKLVTEEHLKLKRMYNAMALYIMGFHLSKDYYTSNTGYNDVAPDWEAIYTKYSPYVKIYYKNTADLLKTIGNDIYITFSSSLRSFISSALPMQTEEREYNGKKVTVPYSSFSSSGFDKIYGPREDRNVYISSYLEYLYDNNGDDTYQQDEVQKPVYANIFRKELLFDFQKDPIPYDYRQYKEIGKPEGKRLAQAALQYLNWGVEYTLYNSNLGGSGLGGSNMVFQDNRDLIENWIGINGDKDYVVTEHTYDSAKAQSNGEGDKISPIHKYEGDFTNNEFIFAGHKKENVNISLSRIDFWTARNYTWDPNYVDTIQFGSKNFFASLKCIDSDIFTAETINRKQGYDTLDLRFNFRAKEQPVGGMLVIGDIGNSADKVISIDNGDTILDIVSDTKALAIIEARTLNKTNILSGLKYDIDYTVSSNSDTYKGRELKFSTDENLDTWWSTVLYPEKDNIYTLKFTGEKKYSIQSMHIQFTRVGGKESKYEISVEVDNKWINLCENNNAVMHRNNKELGHKNQLVTIEDGVAKGLLKYDTLWITLKDRKEITGIRIKDCTEIYSAGTGDGDTVYEALSIKEVELYKGAFKSSEERDISIDVKSYTEYVLNSATHEYVKLTDANREDNLNALYHYFVFSEVETEKVELKLPVTEADISEFLVFDSNPIRYVTDRIAGRDRVHLFEIIDSGVIPSERRVSGTVLDENIYKDYLTKHVNLFLTSNQKLDEAKDYLYFATKVNDGYKLMTKPESIDTTFIRDCGSDPLSAWEQEGHDREMVCNKNWSWTWFQQFDEKEEGFIGYRNSNVDPEVVKKWPGKLYDNDDDQTPYPLSKDKCVFKVRFTSNLPIKTFVVWEKGVSDPDIPKKVSNLTSPLQLFTPGTRNLFNLFMQTREQNQILESLNITTPFKDAQGNPVLGNPIPYAPVGIDSPRTFAYKMWEQRRAREWFVKKNFNPFIIDNFSEPEGVQTTRAFDSFGFENYNESYVTEIDVVMLKQNKMLTIEPKTLEYYQYLSFDFVQKDDNGRIIKPFLPNIVAENRSGYVDFWPSLFNNEKIAGVDSIGLLSGSLGAADIHVLDVFNRDIVNNIKQYHAMKDENLPGLGADGYPVFYKRNKIIDYDDEEVTCEESDIITGNYRFEKSDIERSSILVPDVSYIRPGDILVNYKDSPNMHIGIVVHLEWEVEGYAGEQPKHGDSAEEWWDKVWVISVRSGFKTVTLGTWGTAGNTFNTFSSAPKSYQIRRLVRLKRSDLNLAVKPHPDTWELVTGVTTTKVETEYPSYDIAPRSYWPIKEGAKYADFLSAIENDSRFYRELPATSFQHKAMNPPVKKGNITCLTGFRYMGGNAGDITYHRGVDFAPVYTQENLERDRTAIINTGKCDNENAQILAPEDGLFYIFKSEDFFNIGDSRLPIPTSDGGSEKIEISHYYESSYGLVGVLVTNPDDPREGRIYTMSHMGKKSDNKTDNSDSMPKLSYAAEYEEQYGVYPDSLEKAVRVNGGDWIGWIGTRGNSKGPHLHLEVWEYFPDSANNAESKSWERVEPLSCFDKSLFSKIHGAGDSYGWWREVTGDMDIAALAAEANSSPMRIWPWSNLTLNAWADIYFYDKINEYFTDPARNRPDWFKKFYIIGTGY